MLTDSFRYHFTFHPDRYPGRPPFYQGNYRFLKHYYGSHRIHDLRYRTEGASWPRSLARPRAGRRAACQTLGANVSKRRPTFSFWMPTSTDWASPRFVAELDDGRVLAVEYKGHHLLDNEDTREKVQIGKQWQASSSGRVGFCWKWLPVMIGRGRSLEQQIEDAILGR